MSKAYITDTLRSVKRTISRFISIVAIVALGSSLFVGFNAIYPDMVDTAVTYYDKYNLMDIRLQSYIGIYEDDLAPIKAMDEVKAVQGEKFVDGYVQTLNDEDEYEGIVDIDGSELTLKVLGFDVAQATAFDAGENDENYINRLRLLEGRYPENENECVVTCSSLSTPEQFIIGNKIKVVGDDEEISYYLKNNEFEIVGIIQTPYWISYERGTTTAGSGKLGDFIYVSNDCFQPTITYYSEVYVTLNNPNQYKAYTDEYNDYVDGVQAKMLAASEDIVNVRGSLLKVGLKEKLINAKTEIDAGEAELNTKLADAKAQLEELYELEKTGAQQLQDAQNEMDRQYAAAQQKISNGSDEYLSAVNEYNEKASYVASSKTLLAEKKLEYNANKTKADEAKTQLDAANTQLTLAKVEIESTRALVESTESTLNSIKNNQAVSQDDLDLDAMAARLEETNPELASKLRSLSNLTGQGMAADAIVEIEALLDQYNSELVVSQEQYDAGKKEYDEKYAEWYEANEKLKAAKKQLDSAQTQLDSAEQQLAAYKEKIQQGGLDLQLGSLEAQTKYNNAQITLATKASQYQNIKQYIAEAEKQIAEGEVEGNLKLGLAKTEYNKGKKLYENIENGAYWFVYDRNDSPGYEGYGDVAANMKTLSYIFPTFFFIVSALICLTTMTRMVEEERTQLGTLKALGYSNGMIVGKYLLYAGSASCLGMLIGVASGFYIFPKAIFTAWCIMYEMPTLIIHYIPLYIALGALLSVGITVAAAFFACRNELASVPSVLMRPKPPKDGKRVFLENIKFIWSKLSFSSKVTVRNIFRNKKRFIVTIIGIAGCTALLLAAFGYYNACSTIVANQYGEDGIAAYDLQVVLKEAQVDYENSEIVKNINALPDIQESMLAYLKVCTGSSERSEDTVEVDVLVSQSPETLTKFVNLQKDDNKVALQDSGVLITDKLARKTDTKIGDKITVSWLDGSREVSYELPVSGIVDNYTFNYVYMTPACYYDIFGEAPTYNYLYCEITDGLDSDGKNALETQINTFEEVNGTVYTDVIINNFENIINSLTIITSILIVAAMALAFIVLYNLNNINVNERIRELATLKVLGFYDTEVSSYIYRENVILTLIGIAFGLILGIFLNIAIIGVIDIEQVTFSTDLQWWTFLLAGVLTLFFAFLVNLGMHFKLKKISMVESLKSVE